MGLADLSRCGQTHLRATAPLGHFLSGNKSQFCSDWCGREDSNLHGVSSTTTSR